MSLLHNREMSLQQIRTVVRDDFDIKDASGGVIGCVKTNGTIGRRLALGNRELTVTELDGRELFTVHDVVNLGWDTMVIETPTILLATFRRMFSILTMKADLTMSDGRRMIMKGSFLSFEFTVNLDGEEIARVSRRWTGIGTVLHGKERYSITYSTESEELRAAILGGVLAMDMMLAKSRRSAL